MYLFYIFWTVLRKLKHHTKNMHCFIAGFGFLEMISFYLLNCFKPIHLKLGIVVYYCKRMMEKCLQGSQGCLQVRWLMGWKLTSIHKQGSSCITEDRNWVFWVEPFFITHTRIHAHTRMLPEYIIFIDNRNFTHVLWLLRLHTHLHSQQWSYQTLREETSGNESPGRG